MNGTAANFPDELSAVARLSRALSELPGSDGWVDGVRHAVRHLAHDLQARRADEAEFDAEAVRAEPRLTHSASRQASDSTLLEREVADLSALLESGRGDPPVAEIRARGERLVAHLQRHRHADAVLAHEAYSADVGGGD